MNETINGLIEQIKARKNKKFGKVPVVRVNYMGKISTIENINLPDSCAALTITIQAHSSQDKRLRNVFTVIRECWYGFDGWFKYKGQVIEPSIEYATRQLFRDDNVIMLDIEHSRSIRRGDITDIANEKLLITGKKILLSSVSTDDELQVQMGRIAKECNKALDLEKPHEDNVGPATKSFRERYREYWRGCCDALREDPIKEYHGVVMSSDPPEVEPMPLDPVAEVSLTQFSDDVRIEPFDETDLLALGMEARDEPAEEIFEKNAQRDGA